MKGFYWLCFLVPFFAFADTGPIPKFDPDASEQRLLLTFPRSGTNLISGYVHAIVNYPIGFITSKENFPNSSTLDLNPKQVLYRTHYPQEIAGLDKNGNKLLMILRNYKECIHRHTEEYNTAEDFKNLFLDHAPIVQQYIDTLNFFDNWNPNNRLLVYYEDLIANPMSEMLKVLTFFEESIPTNFTKEFLQQTRDQLLSAYHQHHISSGGSHSKGLDPRYHSKQISSDLLFEIDQAMITECPILFQKYLFRYQEKMNGGISKSFD